MVILLKPQLPNVITLPWMKDTLGSRTVTTQDCVSFLATQIKNLIVGTPTVKLELLGILTPSVVN